MEEKNVRTSMEYLVVMEVSQKQRYIFKTNRLAQNIGASIAVRRITEKIPENHFPDKTKRKHFDGTETSVYEVYAGGGNSVYAFPEEGMAKRFISECSEDVLVNYPGVELFMAMHAYDRAKEDIIDAIDALFSKLEAKKAIRKESFRLYGLGVTESCAETLLPACGEVSVAGGQWVLVSEEAKKKYMLAGEQDDAFRELLPEADSDSPGQAGNQYRFARSFDELGGTKGEKNYVAVVVLDGNRMGKKIEKFRKDFQEHYQNAPDSCSDPGEWCGARNEIYKEQFGVLSRKIDAAYKHAMKETVRELIRWMETEDPEMLKDRISGKNSDTDDGVRTLPFRPLILAGDDVCFVTDARLGISMAEILLQKIEEEHLEMHLDVQTDGHGGWNVQNVDVSPGASGSSDENMPEPSAGDGTASSGSEGNEDSANAGRTMPEPSVSSESQENLFTVSMNFHSCAGVAMVKTSYPFFRAHQLAEELCTNAKSILAGTQSDSQETGAAQNAAESADASVLDFHIVQGELEGGLADIRKDKYKNGRLTNKPFYLKQVSEASSVSQDGRMESDSSHVSAAHQGRRNTMPDFRRRLQLLKGSPENRSEAQDAAAGRENSSRISWGRGAIKEYRDALYEGREAAKRYLTTKRLEHLFAGSYVGTAPEESAADRSAGNVGHGDAGMETGNGIQDSIFYCVDYDVIEVMDLYQELKPATLETKS